ncbi:MAG: hypothetical protein IJJ23_04775 [Clostridia bacterium]|nr:hypothetical protein [Clostridia bacterium]
MSGELISYRYTRQELRALGMVMNLTLPGLDLPQLTEEDFHHAVDEMERAGCVVSGDNQLGVDSLTALLLNEISDCATWTRLDSDNGQAAVLWAGAHMYVVASFSRISPVSLTPCETGAEAREALEESLNRLELPIYLDGPDDKSAPLPDGVINTADQTRAALDSIFAPPDALTPEVTTPIENLF